MKRILIFSVLILSLSLLHGCKKKDNAHSDGINDGVPFNYYTSFEYENNQYDLYKVVDPMIITDQLYGNIYKLEYYYNVFKKTNTSSEWIINYYQQYDYLISNNNLNENIIDIFYNNITNTLNEYETSLNIELEYFKDSTLLQKEFKINLNKEFNEVFVIDLYIPFKLINKNLNQTYTISVPVKTFLAYRNNDLITIVYNNELFYTLNYNEFISLSNVNCH